MSVFSDAYQWVGRTFGLADQGFWKAWLGRDNYSAQSVTQQTALQLSVVWSCVRLLAETISTLPLPLYRVDKNGRAQLARGEDLYTILHDTPNAEMTAVDFWECMLCSMLLWGNGYARKDTLGGYLTGLTPLRPELMRVTRDDQGALLYVYSNPKGIEQFHETEIFHVRGFSIDGLVGLSPIAYARNSMGAAMATEEQVGRLFARGMRPSAVLTMDQVLKPDQRADFRQRMTAEYGGAANVGNLMLLEGGAKFQPLSLNPEDAQLIQTRSFSVEELCRWYRVPPFMVGFTEKSTSWGTGLEQQNIGFLTYSLRPYLKRIEQQVSRSLIRPEKRATFYAEFNLEGLLRADSAARAALYASMTQNGVMTRNEARAKENLPAMDGGDELTVQSNLVPLSMLGKTPPTAPPAPATP